MVRVCVTGRSMFIFDIVPDMVCVQNFSTWKKPPRLPNVKPKTSTLATRQHSLTV